jgi:hypothetical protein
MLPLQYGFPTLACLNFCIYDATRCVIYDRKICIALATCPDVIKLRCYKTFYIGNLQIFVIN